MTTLFLASILIIIAFLLIGVGVLFFNKDTVRSECGRVPGEDEDNCLGKQAGLCPIEDKSGLVKMINQTRIR